MNHYLEICVIMSQYFPKDQCMILQNHAQVRNSSKVLARPMDFNVNKECDDWALLTQCLNSPTTPEAEARRMRV